MNRANVMEMSVENETDKNMTEKFDNDDRCFDVLFVLVIYWISAYSSWKY